MENKNKLREKFGNKNSLRDTPQVRVECTLPTSEGLSVSEPSCNLRVPFGNHTGSFVSSNVS